MPKTTTTATAKMTTKPRTTRSSNPKQTVEEDISINLPPNPFQSEILDLVSKARTRQKKVELLRQYRNDALVSLLIWNFDESVISMLPDGTVPYKPNEAPKGTQHTSLRSEQRSFYNFVKGGNDTLSKTRRETIFIQMLEGLHPEEADLLVLVKDKRLIDKYNINRSVIEEAYPDIKWGGRS